MDSHYLDRLILQRGEFLLALLRMTDSCDVRCADELRAPAASIRTDWIVLHILSLNSI